MVLFCLPSTPHYLVCSAATVCLPPLFMHTFSTRPAVIRSFAARDAPKNGAQQTPFFSLP